VIRNQQQFVQTVNQQDGFGF